MILLVYFIGCPIITIIFSVILLSCIENALDYIAENKKEKEKDKLREWKKIV